MNVKEWVDAYRKFVKGRGEEPPFLVLIGKSGCGKSRWLNKIALGGYSDSCFHKELVWYSQVSKTTILEMQYFDLLDKGKRARILNALTPQKLFLNIPYEGIREYKRNFVPVFTMLSREKIPYELHSDSFLIVDFNDEMKKQLEE